MRKIVPTRAPRERVLRSHGHSAAASSSPATDHSSDMGRGMFQRNETVTFPGGHSKGVFMGTTDRVLGCERLCRTKADSKAKAVGGEHSVENLCDRGEPDLSPLGHARQSIQIKQGIETVVAKEITGFIRDRKLKVTTQIQDQQVRVTGKSRDDLQSVIQAVQAKDFAVALQFQNFRD